MPDPDITELLQAAADGDPAHVERLFSVVYDRLKVLARKQLRDERPDHTLGATALVHEAYLKLLGQPASHWSGRAQFYGVAAQAMRRILVDHARMRNALKRGRKHQVTLEPDAPLSAPDSSEETLAVDEAVTELAREDPRAAKLVELRYFGGMTIEEAADILGISTATAKRDWVMARAWLQRALG